jgi:hypothetical protein
MLGTDLDIFNLTGDDTQKKTTGKTVATGGAEDSGQKKMGSVAGFG